MNQPQLAGQAARLFDFVSKRHSAETVEVRRMLDIGNVSDAAFNANARLALAGDPRRLVCRHAGRKGVWRIETLPATAA